MERAFGAQSFEEEKAIVLRKTRGLNGNSSQQEIDKFQTSMNTASPELRRDRDVFRAILPIFSRTNSVLQWAAEPLRGDPELVLEAVSQRGLELQNADSELRASKKIVLAAVQHRGFSLRLASEDLRGDREVVLAAVGQNGCSLRYASTQLRDDKEIVLKALGQQAEALQYASEALREDQEVVLKALKEVSSECAWKIQRVASEKLLIQKEFMLLVARSVPKWQALFNQRTRLNLYPVVDCAIACKGEDAPVLMVTLSDDAPPPTTEQAAAKQQSPDSSSSSSNLSGSWTCTATLLSGSSFTCTIRKRGALVENEAKGPPKKRQNTMASDPKSPEKSETPQGKTPEVRTGFGYGYDAITTLDDFAKILLKHLATISVATPRGRIFIVFEGQDTPASPFLWDRHLAELLS